MQREHNQKLNTINHKTLSYLSQWGNLLLAGSIGAVLSMLLLPLPSYLLDFLLAINIVGALTILLVSISISDPMKIATFPTILLVATLFRLGLNISSTKLILTNGFAGHIIQTFGYFATSGNMVVGGITFFILIIVQFIVIAKGSERVAEVSARFSLDALPGRQMSIDADLRAGIISQEEAQYQRLQLHRESRMYGAMDGAMKFVKGDAIASILITLINILGGFATGVIQQDLSLTEAAKTYSILTIGDGLVNQIPAILISITAGFIVTRVPDENNPHALGTDIGFQIFSHPQALFYASAASFLIGLIPGFPFVFFLCIALILLSIALYLIFMVRNEIIKQTDLKNYVIDHHHSHSTGLVYPFVIEVGPQLYQIFHSDPRWSHCLNVLYPRLKSYLSRQTGVIIPNIQLSINQTMGQSLRYLIRIFDVPVDSGEITPDYCSHVGEDMTHEPSMTIKPDKTLQTTHGTKLALWDLKKKKTLQAHGYSLYDPEEMFLRHLAKVLKKYAADFIGIQEVRSLLNHVETQYPELVREVIPKMMSVQKLTDITKRLVEEGIPIKDYRLILQTLAYSQPESKDPVTLTEQVRQGLFRMITYMNTIDGNHLPAVTITDSIEQEIREGIQIKGSESFLALPPNRLEALCDTFRNYFMEEDINPMKCVLLTHIDIRRYVRKIIDNDIPDLTVLAFQELDPKIVIKQLGTIQENKSHVLSYNPSVYAQ